VSRRPPVAYDIGDGEYRHAADQSELWQALTAPSRLGWVLRWAQVCTGDHRTGRPLAPQGAQIDVDPASVAGT
jgi:hypothetical protein